MFKDSFEERLNKCLEALAGGEHSLEECLAMFPEDAERLEPLLRTASLLSDRLATEPRQEFVAAARRRFLRVTADSLQESLQVRPQPSFVTDAKQRFMAAARTAFASRTVRRLQPAFRMAAATAGAAFLMFAGVGSFAITTSGDAVPGDWRYPVKRASEDVRLAFARDPDSRNDLRMEFAGERLSEIEKLAANGETIGGGVISDLNGETNSLMENLDSADSDADDAVKVAELALRQQEVLRAVEPLVASSAQDELAAARATSSEAMLKAAQAYALALLEEREAIKSPSVVGVAETEVPGPTATPDASGTTEPTSEAVPTEEPTAGPMAAVTPIPGSVVVVPLEDDDGAWELLVIDRFSVELPSETSGWRLLDLTFGPENVAKAPVVLRLTNADGTAIIGINPKTGDVFWYQYRDGLFYEFVVRVATGDGVWIADDEALRAFGATNEPIVSRIINSIVIAPPPTPTPTPTVTATPTPTSTPLPVEQGMASPTPQ